MLLTGLKRRRCCVFAETKYHQVVQEGISDVNSTEERSRSCRFHSQLPLFTPFILPSPRSWLIHRKAERSTEAAIVFSDLVFTPATSKTSTVAMSIIASFLPPKFPDSFRHVICHLTLIHCNNVVAY